MPRPSDEFRTSLERMAASYQETLSVETVSYFNSRGLGPDLLERYRIGTVNALVAEHASYNGMACIPYITPLGGVLALKFRVLHTCTTECQHTKYITPYPTLIYNTPALDRAEEMDLVAITEGEIDAITLDACCGIPAVAIPGVDVWTQHKEFPLLFQGFSRVLMFRDPDDAGKKLADHVTADVPMARVVRMDYDVNDMYMTYGCDEIRRLAGV